MSLQDQYAPERSPVGGAAAEADRRRAGTFFMGWLILAASMSLAGNVGHALLIAPSETRWLAALAALVPPIVLLAATHSATWLVRARSVGWVYWVALALTAALALGSFALSFDALRSFAVMLGIRESMSWIWPAVIDVAIAHATLCLLSLTRPKRPNVFACGGEQLATAAVTGTTAAVEVDPGQAQPVKAGEDLAQPVSPRPSVPAPSSVPQPIESLTEHASDSPARVRNAVPDTSNVEGPAESAALLATDRAAGSPRRPERALSAVPATDSVPQPGIQSRPAEPDSDTECAVSVERWQPVAESLVRDGITTKDPDLIAKILADSAAGTPPSTIGRRHEVHHTTVNRILSAAEQLTEASTAAG
ncbi:DUF2637 domain-containing protein [Mycolicibacterium obuense]|uniref:DUF2637 domain-containing protein n=1 Tax=Mycolicibacterium obuense TaxID=1807 RepID=A0A0J6VXQ2_9MYCO|nr:DUF2637 domain-containing protein [Mycolicibacterium obuense]KMO74253.1 hypothetical protein MOBUDSM44075_03642 [Mycolicibacterium obuense]